MENKKLQIFIEKSSIKHNNFYSYEYSNYINNNTKIIITCPIHGNFTQSPKNHYLKGCGCPKCGNEKRSTSSSKGLENFINESNKIHKNKYKYQNSIYINTNTKIIITCPEHGNFEQLPLHHIKGIGCSKCSNNYNKTKSEFIEIAKDIHSNKYNYDKTIFINNSVKVTIVCPKHGEFTQSPYHHLKGFGCKKCSDSKGEIFIDKYLSNSNIKFIRNKTFDDCIYKSKLKFDFYLNEYNICIEYDGRQHYEAVDYFGGNEALHISKKRDNIKNKYCKNNNIKLFRIKYSDNIEKKLEKIKNYIKMT